MQHDCESCDRPTNDLICRACVDRLVRDLRALAVDTRTGQRRPGLIADLQDTRFKLDNVATASQGASSPGVQPLPFNFAASDLLDKARTVVSAYARDFGGLAARLTFDQYRTAARVQPRPAGVAAAAEWMATCPALLANFPSAAAMAASIGELVRDIRRMVDRAPDRIFLGTCRALLPPNENGRIFRCTLELYGAPDRDLVRCTGCRAEHDAHERWHEIQARVRDSLATAAEIAGAAPVFDGRQLNVKTIRTWAERGVITTYGHDAAGVAMHHVGEVLSVAASRPQRARRTLAKVA